MTESSLSRRQLRQTLRQQRRALTPQQQRQASQQLCARLWHCPAVRNARRIACYWPNDGEIDPRPFLHQARAAGKQTFLPVLHPILGNRLWFCRHDSDEHLQPNRFGIPEPDLKRVSRTPAWALDVVLMPLVGFSESGGRLGMGGGFYDRTFAFRLTAHYRRQTPRLIGLAHECQRVDNLPIAEWDVPMETVVTDGGIYTADP